MARYVVFDVETPNRKSDRMSAIGITVVEDNTVIDEYYSLVDPETYFDRKNVEITGISEETVKGAPNFPKLWEEIEPLMSGGILVAHNASFDLSVLRHCLHDHGIQWKQRVLYLCTVMMGRRLLPDMRHSLDVMCGYYGIELDHHHAASDSHACAEILLRYISGGADVNSFIRTYSFEN